MGRFFFASLNRAQRRSGEESRGGEGQAEGEGEAAAAVKVPVAEVVAELQRHYGGSEPLAWKRVEFRWLRPMYEAIARHRASERLDDIGVGRIIGADPKHHQTVEAVAALERAARPVPVIPPAPLRDESQWALAAATGGVAVFELPGEPVGSTDG